MTKLVPPVVIWTSLAYQQGWQAGRFSGDLGGQMTRSRNKGQGLFQGSDTRVVPKNLVGRAFLKNLGFSEPWFICCQWNQYVNGVQI